MYKVLIVDDEKSIRVTLCEFLKKAGYAAESAPDVETASQMLKSTEYDIVVTDIIMPRASGMDLLAQIREQSKAIQVIVMTGEPTVETAIIAVQNGANDYLTKPIQKDNFLKAIYNAAKLKSIYDEKLQLEEQNQKYQKRLEHTVEKRTEALQNAMQGFIALMLNVVKIRDPYTASHQLRTGNLAAAIAQKMEMNDKAVEQTRIIGYIHDIGKIVVPTEILSKPGKLSAIEMEMIRNHSLYGYEMLINVDFPDIMSDTIYQHHERCDGSGYPRGLTHEEMTLDAQIIMVADVVEAMASHRPYRPAIGLEAALDEIKEKSGIWYNTDIALACTDLFLSDNYKIDDSQQITYFPINRLYFQAHRNN